uniref:Phenylalanine-tRNA ligase beta subunit n=1 Tax=Nemalion vermiculare TaxID=935621 RepID=UPI00257F84FC|nr:Phenylalanine-tRNA ligase beta subunit [Nemalion vermiculare]WGV34308.1 Phenylalanine-tRNA ligase beta subunit [Nemalion vermiculare]
MNISWKWLGELLDLRGITPDNLSEQLTLSGFEVERVQLNVNSDTILEVNATSNRPDTIFMVGIAREASTVIRRPMSLSGTQVDLTIKKKSIPKSNQFYNDCMYGSAFGVRISESPQWLKDKLSLYEIKSQNNILDIVNLILIKWGKHINLICLDKINKDNIKKYELFSVNKEVQSNKILDLALLHHNDKTRDFRVDSEYDLLIQTEIRKKDKDIRNIQSHTLTHDTHLTTLYKANADNYDVLDAYSEAITLIQHLCKVEVSNITHLSATRIIYKPLYFNCDKAVSLLGPINKHYDLPNRKRANFQLFRSIFHHLNFLIHSNHKNYYISVPSYRLQDIQRQVDLVEEVSRVQGFDQFNDKIPLTSKAGSKDLSRYRVIQIRAALRNMGISEVVHSSFSNQSKNKIEIYNPLTNDYNYLRNELISGLIEANLNNLNQSNDIVNVFEIGRIFSTNRTMQIQTNHLAGLIGGKKNVRRQWNESPEYATWFQAKGDIEELFEKLNLKTRWKSSKVDFYIYKNLSKYFHPKYTSIIYIDEEPAGIFGRLQLEFRSDSTINNMYGFELIVSKLHRKYNKDYKHIFHTYSSYPSTVRDINIEVSNDISSEKVLKILQSFSHDIVDSIRLFDVYYNSNLEKDYKNMSFRIKYRKFNSTLTTSEVDIVESELKNRVYQKLGSVR